MDKSIKIILYIVTVLAIINLVATFLGTGKIKDIRNDLQKAKRTTDSTLNELQYSRNKIDSIKSDMLIFKSYINNIQKTVELNDKEKRIKDEKDKSKIKEMKEDINKLKSDIANDSLPDINEVSTK